MIDKHELMIGSMVLYSDQFGDHEGIISSLGVDTCQIEGHGAYFAYEGLKPIIVSESFAEQRLLFSIFSYKRPYIIFHHRERMVHRAFQLYFDYNVLFENKWEDYMQLHKIQAAIYLLSGNHIEIREKLPSI